MTPTLTNQELSKLYKEKSVAQICKELNLSLAGLYILLDKAKIPRKKKRTQRTKWTLVD